VKPPHLGGGNLGAVPRLCIEYPGICLTTEENHGKPQSGYPNGGRLFGAVCDSFVELATASGRLDWSAVSCRHWHSRQATGSALGKLKYLPSCRTRGFPPSANFESKLSVRALKWSANSVTPRSSCICLLLTYQQAPVARRRHLDCNTCNLRTWERTADLHAGHAKSIRGRMSCLYSRTLLLTDTSHFLYRRGPSKPFL